MSTSGMSKYTPGPWRWDGNVCAYDESNEALEALQTLVRRIEFYTLMGEAAQPNIEQWGYTEGSADMAKARAAISKALGEAA